MQMLAIEVYIKTEIMKVFLPIIKPCEENERN